MTQSLGQYCINVTDLERAVSFWEGIIGIPVQSRTEIPNVLEVVLQAEAGGSRGAFQCRRTRGRRRRGTPSSRTTSRGPPGPKW